MYVFRYLLYYYRILKNASLITNVILFPQTFLLPKKICKYPDTIDISSYRYKTQIVNENVYYFYRVLTANNLVTDFYSF